MPMPDHIPDTHGHGEWTLFKTRWDLPWSAYNRTTGEVVATGESHVERAKNTLPRARTEGQTTGGTYTLMPRRTTASPRGWDVA